MRLYSIDVHEFAHQSRSVSIEQRVNVHELIAIGYEIQRRYSRFRHDVGDVVIAVIILDKREVFRRTIDEQTHRVDGLLGGILKVLVRLGKVHILFLVEVDDLGGHFWQLS